MDTWVAIPGLHGSSGRDWLWIRAVRERDDSSDDIPARASGYYGLGARTDVNSATWAHPNLTPVDGNPTIGDAERDTCG